MLVIAMWFVNSSLGSLCQESMRGWMWCPELTYKTNCVGCKGGSSVTSTCCFSRRAGFNSQHPHRGPQTLISGHLLAPGTHLYLSLESKQAYTNNSKIKYNKNKPTRTEQNRGKRN